MLLPSNVVMSDVEIVCRYILQALMCCFCLFVKFALDAIDIRAVSCTLCGRVSHGSVVFMV
jgi:hypothetical protein